MVVPVPTTNSKTLHERPLWLMYKKICFIKKKKMKLDIFYFVYQSWCFLLISPGGLALQKQHKNMYCPLMSKQENMNKWFFFKTCATMPLFFFIFYLCRLIWAYKQFSTSLSKFYLRNVVPLSKFCLLLMCYCFPVILTTWCIKT